MDADLSTLILGVRDIDLKTVLVLPGRDGCREWWTLTSELCFASAAR